MKVWKVWPGWGVPHEVTFVPACVTACGLGVFRMRHLCPRGQVNYPPPPDFGSSTQLCSHALWASTACFARFACLACFACSACDKIYRMHRTKSVMASSIHTTPFFRLSVRFQFLLVPKSYTGNRLHSKLQWHYSAPLPHARNEPKTLIVRSSFLGFLPSLRLLLLILHYDCPCFQLRKVHGGHFAKWTSDIFNRLEDLGVVGREP